MSFLGMRGNNDWVTDQRPKNYRETILFLYPNGNAPLTAILSKMGSEKVNDPEYNWWTKQFQNRGGAITAGEVYDDPAMGTAYGGSGVAGQTVYAKVAAATAAHFRAGQQVLFRDASDPTNDHVGKCTSVLINGASSYVAVSLLEADDNGVGDISAADYIMVIGTMNPEGGVMPDALAYDPVKWYNFTQIFRTPLEITRTAKLTKLRTGDAYKEAKREALEYHSVDMELATLFGVSSERTGANGKMERTTNGIVNAIRGKGTGHAGSSYAGTVSHFPTAFAGNTWLNAAEGWLDTQLEVIFRTGGKERLGLCGSGAILGINNLVKYAGSYEFSESTVGYGIKVMRWTTAFGVLNLINHPLMSQIPSYRNTIIALEPKNIKTRTITDTSFYAEGEKQNTGKGRIDGTSEEYLTEMGLEYHHPVSWGLLTGVGTNG